MTDKGKKYQHAVLVIRFGSVCSHLRSAMCLLLLIGISAVDARANICTWTGVTNSDWNTASNWSPATVPGSGDDVQIGIVAFNSANQPAVSGALQCASVTFGPQQPVTLTINTGGSLVVSGAVTLLHSENNLVPFATITGSGALTCASLLVGNGDFSNVVLTKTTEMVLSLATITVTGNVYINSVTADLLSGGLGHNDAVLSLQSGVMTVGGQIRLTNTIPAYLSGVLTTLLPYARFNIDVNSGQSPRLVLLGNSSLSVADRSWDLADFYNDLPGFSGSGSANVIYGGSAQVVWSNAASGIDTSPQDYQNLEITGAGQKNTESSSGDTLTVGGNLSVLGNSLNMQANNATLIVSGNFWNTGTTLLGNSTFYGNNFANDATLTTNADTVQFPGNNQVLTDSTTNGTILTNATFTNAIKKIATGEYIIPAAGTWRVTNDSTAMAISPGATLDFQAGSTPATLIFTSAPPPTGLVGVSNRRPLGLTPVHAGMAATINVLKDKPLTAIDTGTSKPAVVTKELAVPDVRPALVLQLSGNKAREDLRIVFSPIAHLRYMPSEDKYALPKQKSGLSFYSYSTDRVPLSVNLLPLIPAGQTIEISAGAAVSGSYTIGLLSFDNIPGGYKVALKDKFTGAITNIMTQKTYTFSIDKKNRLSFGDRFELILTKN